jgi:hypothetical protein
MTIDYLDHPPQRYKHEFQKASGSREMVADREGEWVKFEDMDLYMFEGGQLLLQASHELERFKTALRKARDTFHDFERVCKALNRPHMWEAAMIARAALENTLEEKCPARETD